MKSLWVYDTERANKAEFAEGVKIDVSPVGAHTLVMIDEKYSIFVPGNTMFEVLEENDE